jgi:hypothetical protein
MTETIHDHGRLVRITARQLRVEDAITRTGVVVIGVPAGLTRAPADQTVAIDCLTPRGEKVSLPFRPNEVVHVVRDWFDPTNNPYWWAMEARKEREEDAAAYRD